MKNAKTWIICSAEGYINRGFETYARELVGLLNETYPFSTLLIRSRFDKKTYKDTLSVINLFRLDSFLNKFLTKIIKRYQPFLFHHMGFILSLFFYLVIKKPKTVYVLEGFIYKFLFYYKKYLSKDLKLIFFTGGQLSSKMPLDDSIFLHHVTPYYVTLATEIGFLKDKQFIIPHFTNTKPFKYNNSEILREVLGIHEEAIIVLSVGAIDCKTKRMDYVIQEFAKLKKPKFLILLGHRSEETLQIETLAKQLLAKNEYLLSTVQKNEIDQYYQLADIVVSASMYEGFGLMYVEALANNKIPIVHDFPVTRYVLEDFGVFRDLSKSDELAAAIENYFKIIELKDTSKIQSYIERKYSWKNLSNDYCKFLLN